MAYNHLGHLRLGTEHPGGNTLRKVIVGEYSDYLPEAPELPVPGSMRTAVALEEHAPLVVGNAERILTDSSGGGSAYR